MRVKIVVDMNYKTFQLNIIMDLNIMKTFLGESERKLHNGLPGYSTKRI